MASVKMCDIDGTFFIERAPGSVRINNAVIYDADTGKPREFAGELCPQCGNKLLTTAGRITLQIPQDFHDQET